MPQRTRLLSRLIGLYSILVSLALASNKTASVGMITAFVHDGPLLFLSGALAATAGLAIVLNHNVWSGGAQSVIVTLVGWTSLIKGAAILFLPPGAEAAVFIDGFHYAQLFYLYCAIPFVLGSYLTWKGFSAH
jgi:hypothetical protein